MEIFGDTLSVVSYIKHEIPEIKVLDYSSAPSIDCEFERILRILHQNQQFLFNRGMQGLIGGQESGKLICGNDPMDIRYYTNFLVSYLYNTNRISADERFSLQVSLMEYLTNALEHGNGFEWRKYLSESLPETAEFHGRGIAMRRELVQRVSYNESRRDGIFA